MMKKRASVSSHWSTMLIRSKYSSSSTSVTWNGLATENPGLKASELKPFGSIPGPRGLPGLGTLVDYLRPGGLRFNKMFEVMHNRSKLYGPIYKENIGGFTSVIISDIAEYTKVMKIDGKYPIRLELGPIWHYRKIRGMDLGIVNSQGEPWLEKRQILSPKLLKPPEMMQHVGEIDGTTSDFLKLLSNNFGNSQPTTTKVDGSFVCDNLEQNLFLWALESVGTVLFGTRIGCLNRPTPEQAEKFINSLLGSFETMQALMYGIPVYQVYPTRTWREFERHYGDLVNVGRQLVEKNQGNLKSPGTPKSSDILTFLLSQANLDPEVANLTCIDIMNGAVETTSNGILWSLYCLSRNMDVQETLHKETRNFLPNPDTRVTKEIFQELKYVRACLKEALRLYPITFATSRIIPTDVEVCGYFIPAGTHCQANLFSMGQDEKHFPEPESYRPARWLRDDQFDPLLNTLSTLPFGHGPRMCIGRRLAEMEIYVMLTKLIRNFRVEWMNEGEVKPVLHTVMIPDGPMSFKFTPRK